MANVEQQRQGDASSRTIDHGRVRQAASLEFAKTGVVVRNTLEAFISRLANGDVEGLTQMLSADVVLVSDGGGEINALAEPVYGRDKVVRLMEKLYDAYRHVTRNITWDS